MPCKCARHALCQSSCKTSAQLSVQPPLLLFISAAICLLTHDVMVSAQLQYDSSLVLCQLKCYLKAQQQLISCQLRCTQSVSNQ